MESRIGDRRLRPRFEVVGNLQGTLETTQHLHVHNFSRGGALVEADVPYSIGREIKGHLAYRGHRRAIRAEVRHCVIVETDQIVPHYLVGLELMNTSQIDDLLAEDALANSQTDSLYPSERRRGARGACVDCEIDLPVWSTVELVDISLSGVLFSMTKPSSLGTVGELRMSLARLSCLLQIEVLRIGAGPTRPEAVAASFSGMDDRSREVLETLIAKAGN